MFAKFSSIKIARTCSDQRMLLKLITHIGPYAMAIMVEQIAATFFFLFFATYLKEGTNITQNAYLLGKDIGV